jgi:hypothetical protein
MAASDHDAAPARISGTGFTTDHPLQVAQAALGLVSSSRISARSDGASGVGVPSVASRRATCSASL